MKDVKTFLSLDKESMIKALENTPQNELIQVILDIAKEANSLKKELDNVLEDNMEIIE